MRRICVNGETGVALKVVQVVTQSSAVSCRHRVKEMKDHVKCRILGSILVSLDGPLRFGVWSWWVVGFEAYSCGLELIFLFL